MFVANEFVVGARNPGIPNDPKPAREDSEGAPSLASSARKARSASKAAAKFEINLDSDDEAATKWVRADHLQDVLGLVGFPSFGSSSSPSS